ncbi:hypothetical protein BLOT_001732 [Blomia tropicalis]|nr:hypothetical protein BLOT_001732 [Blomia tropicalis]
MMARRQSYFYNNSKWEPLINELRRSERNKTYTEIKCLDCNSTFSKPRPFTDHIKAFHPLENFDIDETIINNFVGVADMEVDHDSQTWIDKITKVSINFDKPVKRFHNNKLLEKLNSVSLFHKMMKVINDDKYLNCIEATKVNESSTKWLTLMKELYFSNTKLTPEQFDNLITVAGSNKHQESYNEFHLQHYYLKPEYFQIKGNDKEKNILREKVEIENESVPTNQVYYSFKNGDIYLERLKGRLKIELFLDDANLSPGNSNKSQKYLNVYATIADFPIERRTHSDDIEVILTVNRKKLMDLSLADPFNCLFKRMSSELKQLIEKGIELKVELDDKSEKTIIIPVTISAICGDNLGIYEILGFKKSFNNNSFICRYCSAKANTTDSDSNIQNVMFRPLINKDLAQTMNLADLGIMREFALNSEDINRWNISPPDILHDLVEGVSLYVIELILTNFVTDSSRNITKQAIINCFDNFKFFEGSPVLKWFPGDGFKKLELFLKFAAIFFEFFDPNSLPFKLWLVSKEFTLIAFSQNVSKEDCEEMNVLSNIMIHFIKELGGHIFCKLHHITHYGQLIKQFGPLYFYSTFRYERKHQYCKHIARLMRNFINPSKTIHSRHQLRRAIIERNILFYSTNYFSTITKIYNYEPNFQKITPLELNQNYECLLPSERPFPLNKNVLRRCLSTSAAHIFIHATQFYKNINTGQNA